MVVRCATKNAQQDRRNPISLCAGIDNTANKVNYYYDRLYIREYITSDLSSNLEPDSYKKYTADNDVELFLECS